MFQRNQQPATTAHAEPEEAFQADVEDMVAENVVSAQRASKLLRKAARAGMKKLSKKCTRGKGKNQARDMRRKMLRNCKWPDEYVFDCRVKDRRTKQEYTTKLCMLLIHEVLEVLWHLGLEEALLSEDGLDTGGKAHMAWMREQLHVEKLLGFGLFGDGVPCNYDRTESCVVIACNLSGLTGRNGRLRIPLIVLPDWCVGPNTLDDIVEVFAWSMRHGLLGKRPPSRHDHKPWQPSDRKRSNGQETLGFAFCLNQVRGDWDWMGKCFHFPYHNVIGGCCWKCNCRRDQVLPH